MKDVLKEFDKEFVVKGTNGELMADFKDGKIVRPSKIRTFIKDRLKQQREEIKEEIKVAIDLINDAQGDDYTILKCVESVLKDILNKLDAK